MKRKLVIFITATVMVTAGIITYSMTATAHECATCKPTGKCNACKNCKYCKHCSQNGGSCSVCR